MNMSDMDFLKWRTEEAAPEDVVLYERVEGFCEFFEDMCFAPGTKPYELTKCQAKDDDGAWFDTSMSLPDCCNPGFKRYCGGGCN